MASRFIRRPRTRRHDARRQDRRAADSHRMIAMPDWGSLGVFVAAALLLLVTPGPAVLYIVARSVDQARAAGLVSALGVHAGTLVHIAAAAAGLSVLLAASATLFTLVKYLGAAYLIFLGVRRLLDRTALGGPGRTRPLPWRRAFLDGAIVNVLNPKTALFFLAFLQIGRAHV